MRRKNKAKTPETGFSLLGQSKAAPPAGTVGKIKDDGIRRLMLLFTVVDRSKANFYLDMLEEYEVNFQTVIYGRGTADTKMLGLLGISESDKAVILSVLREDRVPGALAMLETRFSRVKNGRGIAFTVPFESVMGVHAYCFLSNSSHKR